MTYIPTKEELEELIDSKVTMLDHTGRSNTCLIESKGLYITFCESQTHVLGEFKRWAYHIKRKDTTFYPASLDDIRTLIRLLTPQ